MLTVLTLEGLPSTQAGGWEGVWLRFRVWGFRFRVGFRVYGFRRGSSSLGLRLKDVESRFCGPRVQGYQFGAGVSKCSLLGLREWDSLQDCGYVSPDCEAD